MEYLYLICYILFGVLAVLPVFYIFCLYIKQKKWEENNKDNILSKKIVYENCPEDNTPTLTEMIYYHKKHKTVRYNIK